MLIVSKKYRDNNFSSSLNFCLLGSGMWYHQCLGLIIYFYLFFWLQKKILFKSMLITPSFVPFPHHPKTEKINRARVKWQPWQPENSTQIHGWTCDLCCICMNKGVRTPLAWAELFVRKTVIGHNLWVKNTFICLLCFKPSMINSCHHCHHWDLCLDLFLPWAT
jgi:hypothetical protein